jgi:zinc/manganese transport system substrate-binding protein
MKTNSSSGFLRQWRFIAAAVVIIIAGGIYFARQSTNPTASTKVHLVAAENFWGNIASQIGGSHIVVTSIITDPSADPHLYESDARDAGAVAGANIVIENGLGYDDFMNKLLAASPATARQILSANTILGVTGNDANPHLWYDIPRVHIVAESIEGALAAKDPAHTADYEANLNTFEASLQPLIDEIATIKAKDAGVAVAYTERVPGYLLADADLSVKTPAGFASAIEDGNNPSPADTQTMDALVANHGIKVLLYNSQATSPLTQTVQTLAKQAGIPIVGVTETLPANEPTYQAWQLDQLKTLAGALSN